MQRCMCWPVLIGRKLDQEGISGRDKDVGSVFGFEGADPQKERRGKPQRTGNGRRPFSYVKRRFTFSSIAQSVEHAAVNRSVVGSSPTGGAQQKACKH